MTTFYIYLNLSSGVTVLLLEYISGSSLPTSAAKPWLLSHLFYFKCAYLDEIIVFLVILT